LYEINERRWKYKFVFESMASRVRMFQHLETYVSEGRMWRTPSECYEYMERYLGQRHAEFAQAKAYEELL
jgi:hypothetical protein